MRKIWPGLKDHIGEDFNIGHYVSILIFLTCCIFLNYHFSFQKNYLTTQYGILKFMGFFLLYAVAYLYPILSYSIFYKKKEVLPRKDLWMRGLLAVAILALDNSLPFLHPWVSSIFAPDLHLWVYKVSRNLISVATVLLPLLLFYYWKDKKERHLYGLQAKHLDFKPYIIMLLLMVPLIIGASFHTSFLNQYPMYKVSNAHVYLGIPEWLTVLIYELAYAWDFVSVELIFRGFMVIGMISVLGRSAVLSMAVVYCFLHFGKPAGEAISSIFGGYILGIIAYETKSIWGGIMVHIGVAWLMELTSFMQKQGG